ncbi:MAG TPA: hypothetical protein VD837_08450 [Terriglobales bacterium]|nr:hypothetical protein [Terriglobales bacterium]
MSSSTDSTAKRVLLSAFLAICAGGVTFYLITLLVAVATLGTSGVNAPEAPMLNATVRLIALPICLLVGGGVFVGAMRRKPASGTSDRRSSAGPHK